jgi:hypothetical protein
MLTARWHSLTPVFLAGLAVLSAPFAAARPARAQSTFNDPGDRPPYQLELEPHLLAAPFNPPGAGSGAGFGAGMRLSYEILPLGFVPSINDSVAIGVGADFLRYQGSGVVAPGTCTRFASGPGGTMVCVEVSQAGGPSNYAFVPLTMQWNFWLTPQWSVFGEPGVSLYWFNFRSLGVSPALFVGARFQLSDVLSITVRLGYPTLSLGVSFLL